MHTRSGEATKPWFRSERFYHTGDGWWFMTREKEELGPFISQREAENEVVLYIRQVNMIGEIPTIHH
ncbi:MAG: hypothetical protein KUG78_00270 [Kangiellaceae bacterium]|nr:hypothetical protein [Kangiellaceae bacterium]